MITTQTLNKDFRLAVAQFVSASVNRLEIYLSVTLGVINFNINCARRFQSARSSSQHKTTCLKPQTRSIGTSAKALEPK